MDVDPAGLPFDPAGHEWQFWIEVHCERGLYVLAGQSSHVNAPWRSAYLPTGHILQVSTSESLTVSFSLERPRGHNTHMFSGEVRHCRRLLRMIGRPSEPAGHLNRGAQYCGSPPNGQSEPCELGPPSEQHRTKYVCLATSYPHRLGTGSIPFDELMLPLHVGSTLITAIKPLSYGVLNAQETRRGMSASGRGPAIWVPCKSSWDSSVIFFLNDSGREPLNGLLL